MGSWRMESTAKIVLPMQRRQSTQDESPDERDAEISGLISERHYDALKNRQDQGYSANRDADTTPGKAFDAGNPEADDQGEAAGP